MVDYLRGGHHLTSTPLGWQRIERFTGLSFDTMAQMIAWCEGEILRPDTYIYRQGKNWYAEVGGFRFTVNANSHTIITVHKI